MKEYIESFIDSKHGLEAIGAIFVYAVVLTIAWWFDISWMTSEGRKNIAGMAATVFVAVVEWRRYRGVNI